MSDDAPTGVLRFGTGVLAFSGVLCALVGLRVWFYGFSADRDITFALMAFWACAVTAFAGLWLRQREATRRPPTTAGLLLLIAALVILSTPLCIGVYQDYQRKFNIWWQPDDKIRNYLTEQTPIGTTQADVQRWLAEHNFENLCKPTLAPSIDAAPRPPSSGGAILEHEPGYVPLAVVTIECVNRHTLPLWTTVTASYDFDLNHRLVRIGVGHYGENF